MATYEKREKEKKRLQKKQEKLKRKEERKANSQGGSLDDMIAYVDENGQLSDTPPDPTKKKEIKQESIQIKVERQAEVEYDPIRKGRVEFFNQQKGYGFIQDIETNEKYFVHMSRLIDEVYEKDKVTFEIEKGPKGLTAVDVKLVVK